MDGLIPRFLAGLFACLVFAAPTLAARDDPARIARAAEEMGRLYLQEKLLLAGDDGLSQQQRDQKIQDLQAQRQAVESRLDPGIRLDARSAADEYWKEHLPEVAGNPYPLDEFRANRDTLVALNLQKYELNLRKETGQLDAAQADQQIREASRRINDMRGQHTTGFRRAVWESISFHGQREFEPKKAALDRQYHPGQSAAADSAQARIAALSRPLPGRDEAAATQRLADILLLQYELAWQWEKGQLANDAYKPMRQALEDADIAVIRGYPYSQQQAIKQAAGQKIAGRLPAMMEKQFPGRSGMEALEEERIFVELVGYNTPEYARKEARARVQQQAADKARAQNQARIMAVLQPLVIGVLALLPFLLVLFASRKARAHARQGGLVYKGVPLAIHSFTGRVAGTNKWSETHVSGGGNFSVQDGYGSGQVNVSSTTTHHDQVFLVDAEGKERAFQLADFRLACRPGHLLTVVWLIRHGDERGPYLLVENHSTHDRSIKSDAGKVGGKVFRTPWATVCALLMLFLPGFYLVSGSNGMQVAGIVYLGFLSCLFVWKAFIAPGYKANQFLHSPVMQDYLRKVDLSVFNQGVSPGIGA